VLLPISIWVQKGLLTLRAPALQRRAKFGAPMRHRAKGGIESKKALLLDCV